MRRLLLLALAASAFAVATPQANAVDCSTPWYITQEITVRGQDVNCWRDYVLDRVPPV
ncbi:MAG TPA: hypothetical protein VNQ77_10270 [Frankiaceae bacterium]|nr:hypothetical protein [Frankiaceae bacterium]